MTIYFYIMFAIVSAVMFTAGTIIAYIEGKKELVIKYGQEGKTNDLKRKI